MIFNIQRFSTHDGEGIRTMIFYKGCTLRCQWCSNPESQSFEPEIMFDPRLCKKFGDCIAVAPGIVTSAGDSLIINRNSPGNPEILRNKCFAKALTVVGEEKSPEEIIREIEKDIPFYRHSKGGVTLSGGEPLAQGNELILLLSGLKKRRIHVSVETALYVDWQKIGRCAGLIDTYLVDLKHTDPVRFRSFTGGDLGLILNNLYRLNARKENIIIRVPVIPEFNHTQAEINDIIDYAVTLKTVREIHFIPYHILGTEKYRMLGKKFDSGHLKPVDPSELESYITYAQLKGLITRTGG